MTADEVNALKRADAAERLTSPHGPKPPPDTYAKLAALGFLYWAPGWRLTDKGRAYVQSKA